MDSSLTRRSLPCAHGKLPRPDAKGLSVVIPTEVACRVFFYFLEFLNSLVVVVVVFVNLVNVVVFYPPPSFAHLLSERASILGEETFDAGSAGDGSRPVIFRRRSVDGAAGRLFDLCVHVFVFIFIFILFICFPYFFQ